MKVLKKWKERAKHLETEVYAIYLAYKDPRVPWYAKLFAFCVVAYAFNPIDLIPDFIPVLGYLDDLILVPLGVTVALKMIPQPVLAECRQKAATEMSKNKPSFRRAYFVIIGVGLLVTALVAVLVVRAWRS